MISTQGALDPTKMWAVGATPGSSSNGPTGVKTRPFQAVPSATTEPQPPQKGRVIAGLDGQRTVRSRPRVMRSRSSRTVRYVA